MCPSIPNSPFSTPPACVGVFVLHYSLRHVIISLEFREKFVVKISYIVYNLLFAMFSSETLGRIVEPRSRKKDERGFRRENTVGESKRVYWFWNLVNSGFLWIGTNGNGVKGFGGIGGRAVREMKTFFCWDFGGAGRERARAIFGGRKSLICGTWKGEDYSLRKI